MSALSPQKNSRPLIVRFGALGDMVILTVMIRHLHERFGAPVDVELSNNVLTIQAEKQQKNGEERRSTSFRRTVTLPTGTNPDKVTASYRHGVLELHIPKTEASRGKRIPVQGQRAVSGPTKEHSQTPPAQGAKKRDS